MSFESSRDELLQLDEVRHFLWLISLQYETQLSNIFSAPLELAKSKIDLAMSKDEAEKDPVVQLNVASTPCLAGAQTAKSIGRTTT